MNTEDRSTINAAEEQGFRFNPDQMTAEEENAAQLRQFLAEAQKDTPDIKIYKARPETAAEKARAEKAMREGSENEANAMRGAKPKSKLTAKERAAAEIAKIQPQLDELNKILGKAEPTQGYKKGGKIEKSKDKNWISKAIKNPGALRKSLGVKEGEKIPAKKLAEAAKKPGKTGQRARLAQTLKGFKEGGSIRGSGCESRGKTRCKFV